jgi:hypothetical protein
MQCPAGEPGLTAAVPAHVDGVIGVSKVVLADLLSNGDVLF